jgi:hypothetical protein
MNEAILLTTVARDVLSGRANACPYSYPFDKSHCFEETGKALKIPLLAEFPFPLPQNGKKVI